MRIKAEDTAILLFGALKSAEKFGHMDAKKTLKDYKEALGFNTEIPKDVVEGCLFGIRLLEEEGHFWHPHFKSLDEFVKNLGLKLDSKSHTIEE